MHYNLCQHILLPVMPHYLHRTTSSHGIVSNEWFSRKLGKEMYCTDDVYRRGRN
jgi:hypothetical protein